MHAVSPAASSLDLERRACGAVGVVGLVAARVERRQHGVAHQAVDLAPVARDDAGPASSDALSMVETSRGSRPLGEGGEAGEVGEEHRHLALARGRRLEVEVAEALLGPLGARGHRDQRERGEHQQVPLPPAGVPVAGEGDGHHRLGEQDEGGDDGDEDRGAPRGGRARRSATRRSRRARGRTAASAVSGASPTRAGSGRRTGRARRATPRAHSAMTASRPTRSARARCRRTRCRRRRRSGREPSRQDEAHRRREHEAAVGGVEQDAGRRERVQAEEAGGGQERRARRGRGGRRRGAPRPRRSRRRAAREAIEAMSTSQKCDGWCSQWTSVAARRGARRGRPAAMRPARPGDRVGGVDRRDQRRGGRGVPGHLPMVADEADRAKGGLRTVLTGR